MPLFAARFCFMVKPSQWVIADGIKQWGDWTKMKSIEEWKKDQTVDANRGQSVRIHNQSNDGLPLSVTIPADMLFLVDVVLREACYRGKQSPELRLWHGEGGTGAIMWNCQFGAIRTWSVTPWGAMEAMGRQIESLITERTTRNGEH